MRSAIKTGPYLPWRSRMVAARLRQQWREAAQIALTPIVHTATDENCPLSAGGKEGQRG